MPGRSFPATLTGTKEKFTGKELDETRWYHFPGRPYVPAHGRWLSVDPLAEKYPSLSAYNYVANNPVLFLDPDGRGIKKNGKFISSREALNDTYAAIGRLIRGETAQINFQGASGPEAGLRDFVEGITSIFSGEPTHTHAGLSSFQLFFCIK